MKRAARKLKAWSKLVKRGRKSEAHHQRHETEQPSTYSSCPPWQLQPSAPPLPEELERLRSAALGAATLHYPPPNVTSRGPSDVAVLLCVPLSVAATTADVAAFSYQQYLAPSPVMGVPFQPTAREGNSNLGACFSEFAVFLNRCLCSCFRYRC